MKSTVILERLCNTCGHRALYTARYYIHPIDLSTPFNLLPEYLGVCTLTVVGSNVQFSGLHSDAFTDQHYLDLLLRALEAEPLLETASWERHKGDVETHRVINIVKRIESLTRRLGG